MPVCSCQFQRLFLSICDVYSVFLYPPVSFRFFFPFATRLSIAYVSTATFHFTLMYLASRLVKFPPLIARGESEMLEPPRTAANDVGCALEMLQPRSDTVHVIG